MDREGNSQLVIGPDGTVLAATGELPPGLMDLRLEDCGDLSLDIRETGAALLDQLRRSGSRVAVALLAGPPAVQVIAIEALAIRRTPTDLRTLLRSKLDVLASQAAAVDVSLDVAVDADVPAVVRLDAEKVAWAVTTLVGNALRYMRVGARRVRGDAIDVRSRFDPTSFELTIEVQDDGPGVPADTVARLFRRDGLNVRGAGLALLLISDICVAHGGVVAVSSSTERPAQGTTIRMTFKVPPLHPHDV